MSTLVAKAAPDFTASAVLPDGCIVNDFNLSKIIAGHYAVLFFYPLDFTFVCPSELIALNNRISEFQKRHTQVIAISIDSQFTHAAWRNTAPAAGGIGAVEFPIVADLTHSICQTYGVEHPDIRIAFRASFVIDKAGIVRAQMVNDLPLGRNIDELLRLIDSVQFHEAHGEVCPANWAKGKAGIVPTSAGVAKFLAEMGGTL